MKTNIQMTRPLMQVLLAAVLIGGMTGLVQAQGGPGFGGGGIFIPGGGGGGGGRGGGAGPAQPPVNASADTRTNTVVVTASLDMLEQIEKVILELDNNPAASSVTYTYPLKNGSAYNIEAVANLLFTGQGGNLRGTVTNQQIGTRGLTGTTGGGRGGGGRGGGGGGALGGGGGALGAVGGRAGGGGGGVAAFGAAGATANTAAAAAGLQGQVTVVADPNTNTLLVTTNPANWPRVKSILDELDRSVPQVLIKVLIAEVSHDNTVDLGTDFSLLNTRNFGINSGGTITQVTGGALGGTNFNIPAPGGLAQGVVIGITEANFTAALRALETTGKLDVLSRPYVLASDNQLASIQVGQNVPYISQSQTTDTGALNQTVAYQPVGIFLDVIPHINPDGLVIMDVAPEISSVSDRPTQLSDTLSATGYNNRSAITRVAVQSGHTVVIGGLMQDLKDQTISKVPFLGDIPWLGEAFKHRVETKRKTELLIFMTPHVASRPDQLSTMGKDEVDHTKLVPNAVSPGVYEEHRKGLDAGDVPVIVPQRPTTMPDPIPVEPNRGGRFGGNDGGQGGGRGQRGRGGRGG